MNYRHEFHAGNFADCMKHAVLVWLLRALARKPSGFFVLDTHAGSGRYDLLGERAGKTGEWRTGIGRLLADPPAELADYLALVQACGLYPGSPVLSRALLRPQDRMACCELHPEDFRLLRRQFAGDRQVAVHRRDGWEALAGLLPPGEKRGLVLIDPPFEAPDEFSCLEAGLRRAHGRFPTGVLAAWYPLKGRAAAHALQANLVGLPDVVCAELCLRAPEDAARLNGCGLIVVNPPFRFEAEIPPLLAALLARLADGEAGAATAVTRLTDE